MCEKQYLSSNELKEYRKLIQIAILSSYSNRSVNFNNLPVRYNRSRCVHCGQSFLFVKDKRKYRYCKSECKAEFSWQYGMFKDEQLLEREKGRCNICKKSLKVVKEREKTFMKKRCLESEDIEIWRNSDCWEKGIEIYEQYSYEVDHIQEIARFKNNKFLQAWMYLDPSNLQLLCIPCHKKKTAKFLKDWLGKPKSKQKSKNLLKYL